MGGSGQEEPELELELGVVPPVGIVGFEEQYLGLRLHLHLRFVLSLECAVAVAVAAVAMHPQRH